MNMDVIEKKKNARGVVTSKNEVDGTLKGT